MTPQEAHEYMENEIRCVQRSKICDRDCGKCELVKEDKPLIEAYGVAILALEKQIPKHPDYEGDGYDDNGELIYDTAYCPYCRQDYEVDYDTPKYCKNCGQALDWSDTE